MLRISASKHLRFGSCKASERLFCVSHPLRKPIQKCGGDSQRVDCSWSQCFKNHYAQTYARHWFQLSHSLCQATLEQQTASKASRFKKYWTAAEWSKVMFSDESKFCISFGNQGARVWRKRGEAHNPRCLRSSVKFPQSVMVWGAMSSAGVGPLCFLRSKVNAAVYQEVLEHFMLPAANQLYGGADFIFQQDLAPAHSAKATSTWFKDHGIPVLNWPANSPDLKEDAICQTQECRRAEGHYQSNLGSHNT
uniref:Tc1-like transposase DDE domain-containing protein n=1 Tax=Cyprinus carpio carpio TaxID=630221 RepID=A0A9J8ACZ8_CYPCA